MRLWLSQHLVYPACGGTGGVERHVVNRGRDAHVGVSDRIRYDLYRYTTRARMRRNDVRHRFIAW